MGYRGSPRSIASWAIKSKSPRWHCIQYINSWRHRVVMARSKFGTMNKESLILRWKGTLDMWPTFHFIQVENSWLRVQAIRQLNYGTYKHTKFTRPCKVTSMKSPALSTCQAETPWSPPRETAPSSSGTPLVATASRPYQATRAGSGEWQWTWKALYLLLPPRMNPSWFGT